MSDPSFDAYRNSYDDVVQDSIAFSGLKHDFFLTAKVDLLREVFAESFGAETKPSLLDVGCGVGKMHSLLQPLVGSLSGTDLSTQSLERARIEHPWAEYRDGVDSKLPFADASFDVATAVCVVHHVPPAAWTEFVREMRRVVRPGGRVVLIEHNPWNPLTRLSVARCPFDDDAVLLDSRRARRLMVDAGLSPEPARHFLVFPTGHRLGRKVEAKISGLPVGAQYLVVGRV